MALTNLNAQPALTQQLVNNALNGRILIGSFLPSAAAVTGLTVWRDGVIATTNQAGSNSIPGDLQIKQAVSPSLNLLCEAGHCVITRSGQGPYLCYLSTQGTLTLAAADTVNPRIDLIVAQVYDSALGDAMPTTPALASPGGLVIRAVTGTPAGSPAVPSVPTGAIPLAQVAVAANATSITNANITDRRKSAMTPSGARTMLPGDAIGDAGAVTGELRYSYDTNQTGVGTWTGTAWQRLTPKILAQPAQSGSGSLASGIVLTIASLAIPDIGGSYYLEVSGSCEWSENIANQTCTLAIEARLDFNSWDDTTCITKGVSSHIGTPSGVPIQASMLPRCTGTLTGAHNVYFISKNIGANALSIAANPIYGFQVKMFPAF